MGFGAGFGGVAALLADLGQAGVADSGMWVGGEGVVELLLGLGHQALGEVVAALLVVLGGLFVRRQEGEADGADLVELGGGLAEADFRVGAAKAFGGLESIAGGAGSRGEFAQLGGFGVGGVQLQGLVDLALGAGGVAVFVVGDGQVVVVVGVGGIGV